MGLSPQLQNAVVPDFLLGIAGQIADINRFDSVSANLEGGANIPFGVGMKKGVGQDGYLLPSLSTDIIEGIAVHSHAVNNIGFGALAPYNIGVFPGQMFAALRQGYIYVLVEEAVIAHGPVFCRFQPSTNFAWSAGPWAPNAAYILNQQVTNYGNLYKVTTAGTSGAQGGPPSGGPSSGSGIGGTSVGGPTGTSSAISDGSPGSSVTWQYVGAALLQVGAFRTSNDTTTGSAWAGASVYALNTIVTNGGNAYVCSAAIASATTAPTGTALSITDGSGTWRYLGASGAAASLVKGAKYLTNASAGSVAKIYFDAGVAAN